MLVFYFQIFFFFFAWNKMMLMKEEHIFRMQIDNNPPISFEAHKKSNIGNITYIGGLPEELLTSMVCVVFIFSRSLVEETTCAACIELLSKITKYQKDELNIRLHECSNFKSNRAAFCELDLP